MKKIALFGFAVFMIAIMSASALAMGGTGGVRVVHASPDAPAVDIWVDGSKALTDIEFNEATGFAQLPKGKYNVQVVPAGATQPVVIDADLRINPLKDLTVVAVGYLGSIEPLVISDFAWRASKNRALVRFVHASPDAPAVDIAVANGRTIFRDVEFKDVSRYLRVAGGEYDLEVRVAGTKTVALEVPGVMLENGKAYTIFATGTLAEGTLGAKLVEDRESKR